ncbi:hypothetical protein SORBI_3006G257250 [Sorghum bicolor]|uniref:Uncharacterized protein n=1 Tax=Sorghum bicolor TaxID=4558 RepID=A0A1Z5RFQ1_SORBI|nr:hypothetical protein SORBI_3006G257250 [Sorghum bicolor]
MCKLVHSRRSTTPAEQAEPSRWSPINTAKTRGKRRARACARVPCRASNGDANPARAAPNSDGPSEPTTLPPALSSRPTARLTRAPNTATPTLAVPSTHTVRTQSAGGALGSRLGLPGRQMVRGLEQSLGARLGRGTTGRPAGAGRQGGGVSRGLSIGPELGLGRESEAGVWRQGQRPAGSSSSGGGRHVFGFPHDWTEGAGSAGRPRSAPQARRQQSLCEAPACMQGPQQGNFKVNSDEAFDHRNGSGAWGFIIRDDQGAVVNW